MGDKQSGGVGVGSKICISFSSEAGKSDVEEHFGRQFQHSKIHNITEKNIFCKFSSHPCNQAIGKSV